MDKIALRKKLQSGSKKPTIEAKARLQYGKDVYEISVPCVKESQNVSSVVDRLFQGSTVLKKYVNIKIMDFKTKARELFSDIPEDSVVVFRDVHQMQDIIFGKHLAKSLGAWDARIGDRIKANENKVFRHSLLTLKKSWYGNISPSNANLRPRSHKRGRTELALQEDSLDEDGAESSADGADGAKDIEAMQQEREKNIAELENACDFIWQLTSLRRDEFFPKLYSVELAGCMLECLESESVGLCTSAARIFWFVAVEDKPTQLMWRRHDLMGSLIRAIEKHGNMLHKHEGGECVYHSLYHELAFHDPDLTDWHSISHKTTCGEALLALLAALNSMQGKRTQFGVEYNESFAVILASISTLLNRFGKDLQVGVALGTFASISIHHPHKSVWLMALYASAMTLGSTDGRLALCKLGGWKYIGRVIQIANENSEIESTGNLPEGRVQFENYIAMALNALSTGAVWIHKNEKNDAQGKAFIERLPPMLSTKDEFGDLLFRYSGSLNVITASTTCATIANLVSLGVSLSVGSCSEFLKVIERPAATDVCIATASALSTALIAQSYKVVDNEGGHFFVNLVVALGKRMKYGCEPATQRYLAASMLSLVQEGTIGKMDNHGLSHKIVTTIARLPSFSTTCDWFALDCAISSLWSLAKFDACCDTMSHTSLIEDLFTIIRFVAGFEEQKWSNIQRTVRKRIVGTLFLISVTNQKARHRIICEDYAKEVVMWLEDKDEHVIAWTCAMFWDALYATPKLAEELLPNGIIVHLVHVATKHPGITPITRQFAAGALEAIADAHPHALVDGHEHGAGAATMERLYIALLADDDTMLNEIACRGIADLALYQDRAQEMLKMRVIEALTAVLDRSLSVMETSIDPETGEATGGADHSEILSFGINVFRNLSVWPSLHVSIARLALRLILRARQRIFSPQCIEDIECTIYNIGRNAKTTNLMYKAQLKVALSMHKLDREESLRNLLHFKSKSKQIRRRITDSGACDHQLNSSVPNFQSGDVSTIWDTKRIKAAADSIYPFPLAAEADLVMAEDKVRLTPIRTLTRIITRPPCLTLASVNPEVETYRYGNVWNPKLSGYVVSNEEGVKLTRPDLLKPLNYSKSKTGKKTPEKAVIQSKASTRPSSATVSYPTRSPQISFSRGDTKTLSKPDITAEGKIDSPTTGAKTLSTRKTKKTTAEKSKDLNFTVSLEPAIAEKGRTMLFKAGSQSLPGARLQLSRWPASLGSSNSETTPIFRLPDQSLTHYYVKSDLQNGRHPGHSHRFPGAFVLSHKFPGVHSHVDFPVHSETLQPPEPFTNENLAIYHIEEEPKVPITCSKSTIPYVDNAILLKVNTKKKSGARKQKEISGKKGGSSASTTSNLTEDDDLTDEELCDDSEDDEEDGGGNWSLFKSVFRGREKLCESRDFYDREEWLRGRMLDIDWQRLLPSKDFVKVFDGGQDVMVHGMQDTKDLVAKWYDPICDCFEHYAIINPKVSVVSFNTFKTFLNDFKLVDSLDLFLNMNAHEQTFIIANKEESSTMDEDTASLNKANDDRSLMRFEWFHAIVRIAVGKYIQSLKRVSSPIEAVKLLVHEDLIPNMDPDSRDSNQFRKDYLYKEDVDNSFRANMDIFLAIWKRFSTKSRHEEKMIRRMTLKDWLTVWTALTVFDEGFGKQQAKLVFERSKMKVIDDWKDAARGRVLCFEDFLEGVARIADIVPIPSEEDIKKIDCEGAGLALRSMHTNGSHRVWCKKFYREKAMYGDMRKMSEKLDKFADIMKTKWSISHWNPANSGLTI
jgi:hypothetical protein